MYQTYLFSDFRVLDVLDIGIPVGYVCHTFQKRKVIPIAILRVTISMVISVKREI